MNSGMPGTPTTERQLAAMLTGRYTIDQQHSPIDWSRLLDLAKVNGVSRMLYTVLLKQGITPPPPIAERIRSIHLAGVIDGSKRHHQFNTLLAMLTNAGITVIPLKGVWLSETVYPNIAMRGMADIDLWIRKEDIELASKLLQEIGYQESENADRPRELQVARSGEILLYKNDAPFVELHWGIFLGEWLRLASCIDERQIWERSLTWKGEKVRHLQPEDALIHIAIHVAVNHHMAESVLRAMLDLYLLCQQLNIDWDLVVERAKTWQVSVPLWFVGDCMIRLFGDNESMSEQLLKLQPSGFRRWILRRFFSPDEMINGDTIVGLRKYAFLLSLTESNASFIRLVWQSLFPDRTWLTLRYGLKDAPLWRIAVQRILHPLLVLRHRKV
jgi:hypothetical protein